MKNFILILMLIFLFVIGFWVVKKIDIFIEKGGFSINTDEKKQKNLQIKNKSA